jgi:hypothetical protein
MARKPDPVSAVKNWFDAMSKARINPVGEQCFFSIGSSEAMSAGEQKHRFFVVVRYPTGARTGLYPLSNIVPYEVLSGGFQALPPHELSVIAEFEDEDRAGDEETSEAAEMVYAAALLASQEATAHAQAAEQRGDEIDGVLAQIRAVMAQAGTGASNPSRR